MLIIPEKTRTTESKCYGDGVIKDKKLKLEENPTPDTGPGFKTRLSSTDTLNENFNY